MPYPESYAAALTPAPEAVTATTSANAGANASVAESSIASSTQRGFAEASTSPSQSVGPQLTIPSINLSSPIIAVGVTADGQMAVPSGNSNAVGWYKYGTEPGYSGSAVLDAHVFAAFEHLDQLRAGDDLYVDWQGQRLHFVVRSTQLYLLANMDKAVARSIFNQTGGRYLNLITCAGKLTPDRSTYDHRLVIRTELVD